jgi:hypothetical protein
VERKVLGRMGNQGERIALCERKTQKNTARNFPSFEKSPSAKVEDLVKYPGS